MASQGSAQGRTTALERASVAGTALVLGALLWLAMGGSAP